MINFKMIKKSYVIPAIIFLVFTLFVVVLVLLNNHNGGIEEKLIECVSDSDCIKVQTTCCPCQMGGIEKCVNSKLITQYQETLNACPPGNSLICPAMYNCQISACLCEKGKCVED